MKSAYILLSALLVSSAQAWLRFGAQKCMEQCFDKQADGYYCVVGRERGWCCPASSRAECQENPANEVSCSYGAREHAAVKYSYCMRKTDICSSKGTTFTPLLNINQTFAMPYKMRASEDDVCWYEIKANLTQWNIDHPFARNNETFINLVFT